MLTVERHPSGLRVRVLRQRIHHGAVGCALLSSTRTRLIRLIGLALIVHDARDWRNWFRFGWQ